MLQPIVEYGKRIGITAEPGFKAKDAKWAILFNRDCRYLDVAELGDASLKRNPGKTFPNCPSFNFSEMKAGGITKSHFLLDTLSVITLYRVTEEGEKALTKHEYFLTLLEEAAELIPQLLTIAGHLRDDDILSQINNRLEDMKARPTDKATIRIGTDFPVESDECINWWREKRQHFTKQREEDTESRMVCLATGNVECPTDIHLKIEGLADVGGMPSGDALISFKQASFESYGLKKSLNAAVCEQSVNEYVSSLNHLIKNNSRKLAGVKIVHWFQETVRPEDDPLSFIGGQEDSEALEAREKARKLLDSIRTGQREDLRGNRYYALSLSGSSGRVMVRDWMEGSFEELASNIDAWFDDLAIVHRSGNGLAPSPRLFAILGSCVRDIKDLPDPFIAEMWRVAVSNRTIPRSAAAMALERAKIGIMNSEQFNHARMGLLKALVVRRSNRNGGGGMKTTIEPYLNEGHPSPAYQCGRLLAVLAELQRAALGDVGAGVVQRYYAAASSTPAIVLGRLSRTGQFHLNKLDAGLARWYDSKLSAIWSRLEDSVPRTLNLEEQTLFALGYYQQLADMRKKKDKDAPGNEEVENE